MLVCAQNVNVLDHGNNNVTIKIACSNVSNLGLFDGSVFSGCASVDNLKLNIYSRCEQNK